MEAEGRGAAAPRSQPDWTGSKTSFPPPHSCLPSPVAAEGSGNSAITLGLIPAMQKMDAGARSTPNGGISGMMHLDRKGRAT